MAICPRCKHEGAYVGATQVECPNHECWNFTKRQLDEWQATRPTISAQETLDSEDPVDQTPFVWCWSTHHHDFGD